MLRAVIDSNSVDLLPEHLDAVRVAVAGRHLDLLWTHVTIDELSAIPDTERRAWLLCMAASVCRFVLTGAAVADWSRADLARCSDDTEAYEAHRLGNHKHTRDALVSVTAAFEGAAVVTYDRGLRNRAEARGLTVYDWASLLAVV